MHEFITIRDTTMPIMPSTPSIAPKPNPGIPSAYAVLVRGSTSATKAFSSAKAKLTNGTKVMGMDKQVFAIMRPAPTVNAMGIPKVRPPDK